MSGSARNLVEALEDRRLLAATGVTKHYVPNAISQLRVDSKGRTVAMAKPGVLRGVNVTTSSSNAVRRVNPSAIQSGFQIEVRFPDNSLSASQKAVFTSAADRWESIILGDLPNVTDDFGTGVTQTVDDLVIEATAPAIDGVNGILGQAGPEYYRVDSFLPITGVMEFDSADVASLESGGQLANVIIHEMGHVLGLGVFWDPDFKNILTGAGGSDPRYTGSQGTAQYNAIFGLSGSSVPVENSGGAGTRDSHWRESTFNNELMTGYLNGGVNPISRVTIGQWADMGYSSVNFNGFDVYTPPGGGNAYPTIASLSPSAATVPQGNTLNLTANSVNDSNGSVASVRFYRESNGIPGLQVLGGTVGDISGDTLVATDTSSAGGFTASLATSGQPLGTQTYYSQATDNQNLVSVSRSTTATLVPVSVTGVVIDDGSAQRSRVRSITVNVNGVVLPSSIQSGAITLTRTGGGTPTVNTNAVINGTTTAITLTFSGASVVGGSLPDGNYTLSINGAQINVGSGGIDAAATGTAGSTRSLTFHRLFGDKDGDRGVSINDFNAFASSFGATSPAAAFDFAFDYEGDNGISINDFNEFATRFGVTV